MFFNVLAKKGDQSEMDPLYYSRLSLNGHLYKTDTSVKRTPRVGPCLSLLPLCDFLYKMNVSLRRTAGTSLKGVHLRESLLYMYHCTTYLSEYNRH